MFINVYSCDGQHFIESFESKEEADAKTYFCKEKDVISDNSGDVIVTLTAHSKRICCFALRDYILLEKEKQKLLEMAEKCKANNQTYISLMTAYSRFWWNHRNVKDDNNEDSNKRRF